MLVDDRSSLRLIELYHLKHQMNNGVFNGDGFNKLVRLNEVEASPLSMFLLGKAYYLGLGTNLDKNKAMSHFEYVSEHGNYEVLTQMFMLLMDDESDKVKVMIVNALQKAKKEFTDMASVELEDDDDDFLDDFDLEDLPRA